MERNDCDWVEFEEMYGLCQWVGINVFYIVLFRLELVSSSNVIRFYSLRQIAKSNDTFRGKKESHHYSSVHTKGQGWIARLQERDMCWNGRRRTRGDVLYALEEYDV